MVAGTALALSLKSAQRLNLAVLISAYSALVVVAASVTCAATALITLFRVDHRIYGPRDAAAAVYNYAGISDRWPTFDEFRQAMAEQSPEQQLRGALVELWRASGLHRYRYKRLRWATRLLLVAIGLLLITVALAAVTY
ncbi:hypothetical protein [Nocardia sp. NPDC057030]|uniref:hypothetical protein n=1 Tax=unclassified Nocardia TaxID=2637762 RepID=UPI0036283D4B